MVDQILAKTGVQISLGHRHAKCVRNALAQRAGSHFDADGWIAFGVAFAMRAEFAKALDFFNRETRITRQMQQRIHQHGAMSVGQHHPVAVPPSGLGGVELEVACVERSGNFCHAQRHALVAFLGFDNGVDRQKPNGVGEVLLGMKVHVVSPCTRWSMRLSPG